MSNLSEPAAKSVSAASLGWPGAADAACCSLAAIGALSDAAGPGLRLSSLALELTSRQLGAEDIRLETRTEKRTRAIVFASVTAHQGGEMVFMAQGLFGPDAGGA